MAPPETVRVTSNYKAPPAYSEDQDYCNWKLDLQLWQEFTGLEKKRQGTALLLELKQGKIKDTVRSLGKDVLIAEDAIEKILSHLDKIYLEDSAQTCYRVYGKFEKYVRPEGLSLQSYISEFEKLIADLRRHKITLPEAVLAYRFLNSANLPSEKYDLALATVKDLTYKDMCETIGKIFSVQSNLSTPPASISVKVEHEECNYTYNSTPRGGRGNYRRMSRGRGNHHHPYSRQKSAYTGCYACGDKNHIAKWCTSKNRASSSSTDNTQYFAQDGAENITAMEAEGAFLTFMVVSESEDVVEIPEECLMSDTNLGSLVYESLACAVIDSGCTKTVVGRNWVNHYRETLEEKQLKMMVSEPCLTPFRFGDGLEVISTEKTIIPGRIGKTDVRIEANIVEKELPLLLSKASLKRAGAVLDFTNDTMRFSGDCVDLFETKSKHYCVPLCNKRRMTIGPPDRKTPHLVMTISEEGLFGTDEKEIRRKVEKIHKQFSHPPSDKLKTLLKTAGFKRPEYMKAIDEVSSSCKICLMYKKPKSRPVVGLPRGKVFNECVAMDLKNVPGTPNVYILHMIDSVTRYSAARIIYNKKKETIIQGICSGWISIFGNPKKFMADNGGEFANEEFNEMCQRFNVDVQNSAAESPWSNGIVERHHKMLTEMMVKTKEDSKCNWEVALCWALSAKNSMQMFGGFSANQLTMGRNPSLPNVIDDRLPALEETTVSKTVADNVNAMHSARQAFAKCESSNKIRRALQSQVRTSNDEYYSNGEKVMYKRKGSAKWSGPGVILGRDITHLYILKHGNQYYKCNACHLTRDTTTGYPITSESVVRQSKPSIVSSSPKSPLEMQRNFLEDQPSCSMETTVSVPETETLPQSETTTTIRPQHKSGLPKAGSHVEFLPKYPEEDGEIWHKAYIHSRAGKSTGTYKNCVNIQLDGEESIQCVDWYELAVNWRDDLSPESEEEVLLSSVSMYDQAVVDAKLAELEKFKVNKVYVEVDANEQSNVGVRWVITKKAEGSVKARLVALGYQENSSNIRKDSPTCNRDSIRLLLTIVATESWKLQHIDVQAAFLQGKKISRDVFIIPPKEAETRKIWKLNKCIYGLVDGPRMWYVELRDTLVKLNVVVSSYDESFMFWYDEGKLEGIIAVHVDDLMFSGSKKFEREVIGELKKKFRLSTEVEVEFAYTGLDVKQTQSGILVSQLGYADQISRIKIDPTRVNRNTLPINEEEKQQLRTVCGQLLWVSTQTRPDVAYATCFASNSVTEGTIADLKMVNKTVKFLEKNPLTLRFKKLLLPESVLVVFCDASYGNLKDGSSQGGFIIFLVSLTGKSCPITWQSRKIRRVCKSTLAAESWAMIEAVETCELIQAQLSEIMLSGKLDVIVMTDCKSLHDAIQTSKNVDDKGLRIPIACLRQRVNNSEMTVRWISTKKQLADCLTKAGAPTSLLREVLSSGEFDNELFRIVFQ